MFWMNLPFSTLPSPILDTLQKMFLAGEYILSLIAPKHNNVSKVEPATAAMRLTLFAQKTAGLPIFFPARYNDVDDITRWVDGSHVTRPRWMWWMWWSPERTTKQNGHTYHVLTTCTHVVRYIHTCNNASMHTCIYLYLCTNMCAYMYLLKLHTAKLYNTLIYIYIYMCVCVVCKQISTCKHIYIYVYTYIRIRW